MKQILNTAKIVMLGAFMALPLSTFAHTYWCGAYKGGTCNCGGGGYAVPLEGAAILLIAGAAGLGVKRFRKNKNDK
jgi:hypothetical protein